MRENSLPDPIDKVELSFASELEMATENTCRECDVKFTELSHKYSCQGCRKLLCGLCVRTCGSLVIIATSNGSKDIDNIEKVIKACRFCSKASKRITEKIYPSESPGSSPELPSPLCGGEKIRGDEKVKIGEEDCISHMSEFQELNLLPPKMKCFAGHGSHSSFHGSPIQSDEEPEESGRHFFSSTSEYYHDSSDIDISVSFRHECYSFRSEGSSPIDSPSRLNISMPGAGLAVQQPRGGSPKTKNSSPSSRETMAILRRPGRGTGQSDETIITRHDIGCVKPLDFENNVHVWFPPPPEDEEDEAENNYFECDEDDENDDGVGVSDGMFSSSINLTNIFPAKDKQIEEHKEPLKAVIQRHFRALVSQLLQGEGIKFDKENGGQDWLDIVSMLAWQAANFVKPDTSKGGSMDPLNYIKIKCIASGSPNESSLVKGIVCTKNIKHKRMTSQYKNPRLLLLGGSLEYQRAQNQLASFNTLLEEGMNHLKMIVSKIEAHRTNVLLVEKSVSSYAQEYLLAKEISLVLNVKRPLLERIAQCSGASITPSVDNISVARLGQCELFWLDKVSEELEAPNQYNRRPSKTLMYFEGCPRRLGCTVLLKGLCREELKKIKHVVQYAVFAAYHLSLETSFLADEGAHLPKMIVKPSYSVLDSITAENATSTLPTEIVTQSQETKVFVDSPEGYIVNMDDGDGKTSSLDLNDAAVHAVDAKADEKLSQECWDGSVCNTIESTSHFPGNNLLGMMDVAGAVINSVQSESIETVFLEGERPREMERIEDSGVSNDYFAAAENHQSILVSFSSRCVSKGTLCERSRLLRIRYYGSFDKPLGRYLRDDLFDQASVCHSCKELVEAHVQCYTHRQGSLTINVRRLDSLKLPGEHDGKIWMWHRCLRCAQVDGVPPATRRVIMSDAAWGLSFGKFLELSFSNHATANRLASCGHSLQRDCLRFYGFGSMVAFFHYSPIDILTVRLPSPMLECDGHSKEEWIRREVDEIRSKMETLYVEISDILCIMEQKSASFGNGSSDSGDLHKHIQELKDLLDKERDDYHGLLLQVSEENSQLVDKTFDILELNRLRRSLLICSHAWDRQLYSLDSLLNLKIFSLEASEGSRSHAELRELNNDSIEDSKFGADQAENTFVPLECTATEHTHSGYSHISNLEKVNEDGEITVSEKSSDSAQSPASSLSDKIDSAWTGTDVEAPQAGPASQLNQPDNLPLKRLIAPVRVYSFDSAMRIQEKHQRNALSSHLSAVRSFHASGDYRSMVRDPTSIVMRTYSQISPNEVKFSRSFISSVSQMAEGPRLLLPQAGHNNLVIAVYDDEPTSVISYALSSKEYEDWVSNKLSKHDESWCSKDIIREDSTTSTFLSWQSFGSLDLDYISYGGYGSEDASSRNSMMYSATKKSPHLQINFDDDSSVSGGKVKFSVTCYFAQLFDTLRKKCYRSEVDFVCSLSRCKRWSAQGGKSNVYFAKTMDERFIIKLVTKTELESFQEFAPEYFKYLNDSVDSGSPTCLAKILGIFQVTIKHLKGARELKMDLMVMENLFFNRCISRIYDLKGSLRSRYNPDTTGANKVLLDMNLLETLRTNPIFLGSKAKRWLERAVWNDTSFLASVDVMDYSLLVGVDEERKELVLGIIDFMRQYTWDKHLETWVKASGILGGSKNASPTIISPKQYKKRFRKAMTSYFLTVPDQWSS